LRQITSRKFDWLLGAAFLAAPFYWWILATFFGSVADVEEPKADPKRLLMLILVYPVLEEIVFRGALQTWLRRQTWGLRQRHEVTTANLLTSIVFTAAHFVRRPTLWSAGVIFPSLVFGFFRDRYGTLYAPIALHIFYNSGPIWLTM
jgi:membrane protease YdiL (CAAX protease family)